MTTAAEDNENDLFDGYEIGSHGNDVRDRIPRDVSSKHRRRGNRGMKTRFSFPVSWFPTTEDEQEDILSKIAFQGVEKKLTKS